MLNDILLLKERIFRGIDSDSEIILSNFNEEKTADKFDLEEILEMLTRQGIGQNAFIFSQEEDSEKRLSINQLSSLAFLIEEGKIEEKKLFLYEFFPNTYYVYSRGKKDDEHEKAFQFKNKEQENNYGLFAPTGVIVKRVPQNILGTGVLGRAFVYSNYIEVLDSLMGNEYFEVLTHEVLHIMYPERKETEIRQMTRNYVGNTIYH